MKKILTYRAKAKDTGKWVFGFYFTAPLTIENFGAGYLATPEGKKISCISTEGGVVYEVDFDTLGQFTGFKDDKGKEVYEGDVVRVWDTQNMPDEDSKEDDKEFYEQQLEDSHLCDQIVERSEHSGYFCKEDNGEYCPSLFSKDDVTIEVIGNIHDNKKA